MKTYIKLKFRITAVLSFILFMMNACTDNYLELNTPKDLITEDLVNVDYMLTFMQVNAFHLDAGYGNGGISAYSGMNARGDAQLFNEGSNDGPWNDCYGNYARNLADIIRICQKRDKESGTNDNANKIAIARILKVWAFSRCTDVYGDIPYFESLLPEQEAVFQPKYDTQKSIYEDFFKELKEAVAQLDDSKATYGSADLLYKGDVEKWEKFANSLRLRLALRVWYADETLAQENMSDLTEDNLITSRSDDAYMYSSTKIEDHQNDWYTGMVNRGYPGVNDFIGKTMLDILIGTGDSHHPVDPRTKVFADTAYAWWPPLLGLDYFGYRGLPLFGSVPPENKYPYDFNSVSKFSAFWYAPIIERPVMRCSEVYFSLAEAALFGLISGDADEYYKKGIDAAIAWAQEFYETSKPQMADYLPLFYSEIHSDWSAADNDPYFEEKKITQEEIDAFKASAVYTLSGTDEQRLEQIINQKIVALFPLEYQGWTEYRRTGYPRILIGDDGSSDLKGTIPRRMPWPDDEVLVNSENYAVALERLEATDTRLTKIWWDVNPNPDAPHEHPGEVEWMDKPYGE